MYNYRELWKKGNYINSKLFARLCPLVNSNTTGVQILQFTCALVWRRHAMFSLSPPASKPTPEHSFKNQYWFANPVLVMLPWKSGVYARNSPEGCLARWRGKKKPLHAHINMRKVSSYVEKKIPKAHKGNLISIPQDWNPGLYRPFLHHQGKRRHRKARPFNQMQHGPHSHITKQLGGGRSDSLNGSLIHTQKKQTAQRQIQLNWSFQVWTAQFREHNCT